MLRSVTILGLEIMYNVILQVLKSLVYLDGWSCLEMGYGIWDIGIWI